MPIPKLPARRKVNNLRRNIKYFSQPQHNLYTQRSVANKKLLGLTRDSIN